MSGWKSIQLGWKKFDLKVNGDGSAPSITLVEYGDYLRRSVTLIGFEVEWFGKKLREASFKSGGDLFLGSLRGKLRWVRIYRVQNKRGRFVEIELRGSKMRRIIRIPEDGQGKGWSQLQNQLVKLVHKKGNRDQDGRQTFSNEISMEGNREFEVPWLSFKDTMDKFQESLGRCCGGSNGSFPTSVTIGFGRWSFVVPILADPLVKQALSGSSDRRTSPKFFMKKTVARDGQIDRLSGKKFCMRGDNFRGARAAVSSTHRDLNFKLEKSKWITAHTQNMRWVKTGQILKLRGENYCARGQNFHVARGARAFSRVSCTEHYSRNKVWVKKGTSLGGSMGINILSPAFSNCGSGINLCVSGANICSPNELSPDNIDEDKSDGPRPLSSLILSPRKAEDIVKSEVASVCNNHRRDLVDLEKNGEKVAGCDVVGDACSPSAKALIPKSGRMLLKKLRARMRFGSRNRAEFFRAQRRVGSIRLKNLIFGV